MSRHTRHATRRTQIYDIFVAFPSFNSPALFCKVSHNCLYNLFFIKPYDWRSGRDAESQVILLIIEISHLVL